MPKAKKKPERTSGEGHSAPSRRAVVIIRYDPCQTGPAELLGGGLARILDVPVFTKAFWRDDIVRLAESPEGGYPAIAEVVFTRHERRSHIIYWGPYSGAILLMSLFSLLGCDSAMLRHADEERPGLMSVAHPAALDAAALARLLAPPLPV
jgi:hypothetical protein